MMCNQNAAGRYRQAFKINTYYNTQCLFLSYSQIISNDSGLCTQLPIALMAVWFQLLSRQT